MSMIQGQPVVNSLFTRPAPTILSYQTRNYLLYLIPQQGIPLPMDDIETLREKLIELQREHQDLDDVIDRLVTHQPVDFLQLQRLKKRKLVLKDTIQKIESQLLPDIIA